MIYYKQLAFY